MKPLKHSLIPFCIAVLAASAAFGQPVINWQAADAAGAGPSQDPSVRLYTSTGQPAVSESTGSGRVLHSGYLFVRLVPAGAATILAPASVDFGQVIVSQSVLRQCIVRNTGAAPLIISSTTIAPGQFSIVSGGAPQTIPPGGSLDMQLRFLPTSAGAVSGSLVITSNAANDPSFTVSLSGIGVSNAPVIQLSTTTLDFGAVQTGSTSARSLTITNAGNAALTITGHSISGIDALQFEITRNSGASIDPGANDYIDLRFRPASSGLKSAILTITSNDPNQPSVQVSLTGTGTSTDQPKITVSQTDVDFGTTPPAVPVLRDVVISNTGSAPLHITSQTVGAGSFSLDQPAAATIEPGGYSSMSLRFNPPSDGLYTGSAVIVSDDPVQPALSITLHGACSSGGGPRIAFSSTVIDFGSVPVLTPSEKELMVRNIGSTELILLSQSIAGRDAIDFSIVQAGASPIGPMGQSTVRIRHLPLTTGTKLALLRFQSNDPGLPTAEVTLISTIVDVERVPGIPSDFVLHQSYPNPATTLASIEFEVPRQADVEVAVYDAAGFQRAVLTRGTLTAGRYRCGIDVSGMPAGVYFYRVRAGARVLTGAMTVLK